MPDRCPTPRFAPGRLLATPGALDALQAASTPPIALLRRHLAADWGDVDDEDWQANDDAIAGEGKPERQTRVLSAYNLPTGARIWVITEADRSATTILLPEEY